MHVISFFSGCHCLTNKQLIHFFWFSAVSPLPSYRCGLGKTSTSWSKYIWERGFHCTEISGPTIKQVDYPDARRWGGRNFWPWWNKTTHNKTEVVLPRTSCISFEKLVFGMLLFFITPKELHDVAFYHQNVASFISFDGSLFVMCIC